MNDIYEMFVKNRLLHIIILVGVAFLFFGSFNVTYSPLQILPHNEVNLHIFITGIVIISIGFVLLLLDKSPRGVKNFNGNWEYLFEESDVDSTYKKHSGTAIIIQDGNKIQIDGFRKYMEWTDEQGEHKQQVKMHWRTSWGWLGEDGVFQYVYDMPITNTGGRIMGYVRIQTDKKAKGKPKSFEGIQYMLPPFNPNYPGSKWGTISFTKVENKEKGWIEKLFRRS